jgi:hydroxyacylglutathione hydrolase
MIFKPYYYFETGCAAYLVGCGSLGSVCGAGMSGKPSSTIAFEKRWNPLLSKSRTEFVAALSDVPPKPASMEQILRINQGREAVAP